MVNKRQSRWREKNWREKLAGEIDWWNYRRISRLCKPFSGIRYFRFIMDYGVSIFLARVIVTGRLRAGNHLTPSTIRYLTIYLRFWGFLHINELTKLYANSINHFITFYFKLITKTILHKYHEDKTNRISNLNLPNI